MSRAPMIHDEAPAHALTFATADELRLARATLAAFGSCPVDVPDWMDEAGATLARLAVLFAVTEENTPCDGDPTHLRIAALARTGRSVAEHMADLTSGEAGRMRDALAAGMAGAGGKP